MERELTPKTVPVKSYLKSELAELYGFSWRTVKKWCKAKGMKEKDFPDIFDQTKALSVSTVQAIFTKILSPEI